MAATVAAAGVPVVRRLVRARSTACSATTSARRSWRRPTRARRSSGCGSPRPTSFSAGPPGREPASTWPCSTRECHVRAARCGSSVARWSGPGGEIQDPHGTAVASLIAGRPRPDGSLVGIAPAAGIVDVRVYDTLDAESLDGEVLTAASLAEGLRWVAANAEQLDIRIANVSLSVAPDDELAAAVRAVREAGVLVVAETGNRGAAGPDGGFPVRGPGRGRREGRLPGRLPRRRDRGQRDRRGSGTRTPTPRSTWARARPPTSPPRPTAPSWSPSTAAPAPSRTSTPAGRPPR